MELNKSNWNYIAVESPEPSEVVPKAEILKKQQPDVIHTLEKPYICIAVSRYRYKCTFCDSSFKLESEVKKHILKFCKNVIIENKMLKHSCSTPPCNIPCTRSTMQYPIESVLEGKKPNKGSLVHEHGGLHTCTECGNKFETERNLNHHLDKIHKKTRLFTCKLCRKEFKDNSNRCRHMKICKKSDQTTESECYSDTRKEILESKSFKDYLVGLGEIKSEPSDEFKDSQKPSASKMNIKSHEEILESKAFNEYVAGLGIVGKRKSEYSEPIQSGKNIKPNLFFPQLIAEALLNSPDSALVISDIFKSISTRHPYYKLENKTWQNTVRCTLTTNVNFTKTSESEGNKHWTLTFSKNPSKDLNDKLKSDIIKVIGKKQLPKLNAQLKLDMIKTISKNQLPTLPDSKLAIETAEHQDPTESSLSEDNFVGLSEMKSESSGKNDQFIENQTLAEIDPLEVQTEN